MLRRWLFRYFVISLCVAFVFQEGRRIVLKKKEKTKRNDRSAYFRFVRVVWYLTCVCVCVCVCIHLSCVYIYIYIYQEMWIYFFFFFFYVYAYVHMRIDKCTHSHAQNRTFMFPTFSRYTSLYYFISFLCQTQEKKNRRPARRKKNKYRFKLLSYFNFFGFFSSRTARLACGVCWNNNIYIFILLV